MGACRGGGSLLRNKKCLAVFSCLSPVSVPEKIVSVETEQPFISKNGKVPLSIMTCRRMPANDATSMGKLSSHIADPSRRRFPKN